MQNSNGNTLQSRRKRALTDAITTAKASKSELELIIMAEGRARERVAEQLSRIGKVRHYYRFIPYISFKCDADYADILVKASSGDVSDSVFEKSFRSIVPEIGGIDISSRFSVPKVDARAFPATTKNRKISQELWNLEAIGAYEAQDYGRGEGVKVAVIDTGIDYGHSQLRDKFASNKGYDFVRNNENPMDQHGHGTHVAGIVAASDFGVAPNSTLYAVRVLDANGSGTDADAIAGIEWCIKNRVDIANMSFGGPMASRALEDACRYAWQNGVVLVAAAGNSGYGPSYPASFGETVIAVAAVDENITHPDFSNIYETNDIASPGVHVESTFPGEKYATFSGTSMASPHIAGALALALSISANCELEGLMKETADRLGAQEIFGAGLVRVDKMAKYLSENTAGNPLQALAKGYSRLETAADDALKGFARDAAAELRRWIS